jgi:hypothetical protein
MLLPARFCLEFVSLETMASKHRQQIGNFAIYLHCKKRLAIFPSPAGMALTKLSLAKNNLIITGQGEFG